MDNINGNNQDLNQPLPVAAGEALPAAGHQLNPLAGGAAAVAHAYAPGLPLAGGAAQLAQAVQGEGGGPPPAAGLVAGGAALAGGALAGAGAGLAAPLAPQLAPLPAPQAGAAAGPPANALHLQQAVAMQRAIQLALGPGAQPGYGVRAPHRSRLGVEFYLNPTRQPLVKQPPLQPEGQNSTSDPTTGEVYAECMDSISYDLSNVESQDMGCRCLAARDQLSVGLLNLQHFNEDYLPFASEVVHLASGGRPGKEASADNDLRKLLSEKVFIRAAGYPKDVRSFVYACANFPTANAFADNNAPANGLLPTPSHYENNSAAAFARQMAYAISKTLAAFLQTPTSRDAKFSVARTLEGQDRLSYSTFVAMVMLAERDPQYLSGRKYLNADKLVKLLWDHLCTCAVESDGTRAVVPSHADGLHRLGACALFRFKEETPPTPPAGPPGLPELHSKPPTPSHKKAKTSIPPLHAGGAIHRDFRPVTMAVDEATFDLMKRSSSNCCRKINKFGFCSTNDAHHFHNAVHGCYCGSKEHVLCTSPTFAACLAKIPGTFKNTARPQHAPKPAPAANELPPGGVDNR